MSMIRLISKVHSRIHISFDNLGGNCSLGLVESFQSFFYCRICELPKVKCKTHTKEDPKTLRTKKNYAERLAVVESSDKVNYSTTRGVKRYCALNKLKYFHMVENISVDILHDLNEGVIPFLMYQLFKRCIFLGIFTEKKLVDAIRFYSKIEFGTERSPVQMPVPAPTVYLVRLL